MNPTDSITSNCELARLLDRSEGAIRQWQKDARWGFGPPPWPRDLLPQIVAYRDSLRPAEAPPTEADAPAPAQDDGAQPARVLDMRLRLQRLRLLEQQTRRAKVAADIAEAQVVRRADVVAQFAAIRAAILARLDEGDVQAVAALLRDTLEESAAACGPQDEY